MRIQRLLSQLKKCWRISSPGISNGTAHHHHHPNDTKCAWALFQNLQAMTLTEEHGPPTVPFHELMDVLRETTTLERLQVERSFVECLSVTEQFMFWRVLSQNTHIQCLSLAEFTEEYPLATSVLVTLFQGQQKESVSQDGGGGGGGGGGGITELDLSHVRLTGNLDSLRHAVRGWTSLERIQLWDVNGLEQQQQQETPPANNNNNTPNSIRQQDILELLLEIPNLQELVLGDGFSFDIPQIDAICAALSRPYNQLKSLRLMGGCSHNQNHNSHDDPFYQQAAPLAFESAIALAKMLQVNQSLTSLELSNLQLAKSPQPYHLATADHGNDETTTMTTLSGLVVMAHALQHANRTLQSLQLFQINLFSRQDLTLEENEALVTMLQDNHVLEYCSASESSGSSHHAQLIQFYLTLNQYNLRGIHVDVNRSRTDMVRLLTETTDGLSNQLDCVYHALRDNPTLVC